MWRLVFTFKHSNQLQLWYMQEMHGKECEGRFLGVKLDAYAARGARQDMQDVDMEQDTASGNGRPERPAKRSGSHKGRQVTVLCMLCTFPNTVLYLHPCTSDTVLQLLPCTSRVTGTSAVKQWNSSCGSDTLTWTMCTHTTYGTQCPGRCHSCSCCSLV